MQDDLVADTKRAVQELQRLQAAAAQGGEETLGQVVIRSVTPKAKTFSVDDGVVRPGMLEHIMASEATPEWRKELHFQKTAVKNGGGMVEGVMRIPVSIFYPPSGRLGNKNKGYIMVAVATCCRSWNMTRGLLESLMAMDDPLHVVIFDDASKDGLPELASEMGFPVFSVPTGYGLTSSMNRAWKYFTSFDALQSLFIMNNDIQVAPRAFTKLHRCLMKQPVAGVLGPMSNTDGVGIGLGQQDCESDESLTNHYELQRAPYAVRHGLPDTLLQYDAFLESATSSKSEDDKVAHVRDIFGFFMGFRKDQPVADSTENILLRGGKNLHQEYWLFYTWHLKAYVCLDVFAYHNKGASLQVLANGKRGVEEGKVTS